jgi:hypothetical protein
MNVRGIVVRFLSGREIPSPECPDRLWGPPGLLFSGDVFSLGVKLPGYEAECPPPPLPSIFVVKDGWCYITAPPYAIVACTGTLIVTFIHAMAVVFSVLHFWTKEQMRTTHGRVWLHSATEGQMRNSVKCKALFIGFARLRYLWKVVANRKHDNVTSLKFSRQTYISVFVLPFQITR